ncbi:MAG: helix-turn-helix transcriptional regulator [Clostridia bacterium]|nr:helix-turn-helix transcriptional regulator [Clostridia bacterium]
MISKGSFNLLKKSFEKFRIQTAVFNDADVNALLSENPTEDVSPEKVLLKNLFSEIWQTAEKTLYKYTNSFKISFACFSFNSVRGKRKTVVIGPFCYEHVNLESFLEIAEKNKLSQIYKKFLQQYYSFLPTIDKDSHLFYSLECFCEEIWKTQDFSVSEISNAKMETATSQTLYEKSSESDVPIAQIRLIEELYSYENQLIDAVSKGQIRKLSQYTKVFDSTSFKQRQPDMLREMKNYCIISNTLFRKAAEKGGVHPYFLDELSSAFAMRIERLTSSNSCVDTLKEIALSYGQAVVDHNTKKYSPIVEKTAVFIWNNFQDQLSLSVIANIQNVSKGYLSAIFKKETGKTVTDFIREVRIKNAIRLLQNTVLKIQTICHLCGYLDFQYFSKHFKRVTGKSPREYR